MVFLDKQQHKINDYEEQESQNKNHRSMWNPSVYVVLERREGSVFPFRITIETVILNVLSIDVAQPAFVK